jgi:hypothetical protein
MASVGWASRGAKAPPAWQVHVVSVVARSSVVVEQSSDSDKEGDLDLRFLLLLPRRGRLVAVPVLPHDETAARCGCRCGGRKDD